MSERTKDKANDRANDRAIEARRAFLKGAGLAGVAAAISVVAADEAEAKDAQVEKSSGYRETDHVNAYYETAKF